MKSYPIFSPFDERINLGLPVFFLGLLGFSLTTGWRPAPEAVDLFNFLAMTLLLGVLHITLTFGSPFVLPEMKSWWKERASGPAGLRFVGLHIAFFLFLLMLFWFAETRAGLESRAVRDAILFGSVSLYVVTGRCWHSLRQSMGLSLLYNRQTERSCLSEKGRRRLETNERWERRLISGLIFSTAIQALFFVATMMEAPLTSAWVVPVKSFFLGLSFVFALALVIQAVLISDLLSWRKVVFSLRYLLYPMSFKMIWISYCVLVLHGLEYFFFYRMLGSRSSRSLRPWDWMPVISMFGIFLCVLHFVPLFLGARPTLEFSFGYTPPEATALTSLVISAVLATRAALVNLHFMIDRHLFRMSDSVSRKAFGGLLGLPMETAGKKAS